jgi:integrase/recombinase XerD
MKKSYPDYNRGFGTKEIEEKLTDKDRKILFDYLKFCRTSASEKRVNEKIKTYTLQSYDIIEKPFDKWTIKDIQEFVILLNDSKKTEWTKNDIKKLLRRFLRYNYRKHKDLDVMLSLIKCKSDMNAFNYQRINENTLVNEAEFEKILRTANTLKQKAILSLLMECALRPQELRMLKWNDVKLDDDVGSVNVFSGKTKKSRTIPIKDSIVHLKRWKQEFEFSDIKADDYIFPNPRNRSEPLGYNALPTMFRRLSEKAGLKRNIFPYMLRHSRITEINKRLPAHLESKFAGHSIKQSQMYTHLSSDDLRNAMIEKVFKIEELSPDERDKVQKQMKDILIKFQGLKEELEMLKAKR